MSHLFPLRRPPHLGFARWLCLGALFFSLFAGAQSLKSHPLAIQQIELYQGAANLVRKGRVEIKAGQEIRLPLPTTIETNSLEISIGGKSLPYQLLPSQTPATESDQLRAKHQALSQQIAENQIRINNQQHYLNTLIQLLQSAASFVDDPASSANTATDNNQTSDSSNPTAQATASTLPQWIHSSNPVHVSDAMRGSQTIIEAHLQTALAIQSIEVTQTQLKNQLHDLETMMEQQNRRNTLELVLTSPEDHPELLLQYRVTGASWQSEYRANLQIESDDINQAKLDFAVHAQLSQNTGEDWGTAPVTLIAGQAQLQPLRPLDQAWVIDLIPLAKPTAKYANQATSMDTQIYDEVKDLAEMRQDKSSLSSLVYEGVDARFELQQPVNLLSGSTQQVSLYQQDATPIKLERWFIPQQDASHVHLFAQLVNQSGFVYLPGPIKLYRNQRLMLHDQLALTANQASVSLDFGQDYQVIGKVINNPDKQAGKGIINEETIISRSQLFELTNHHQQKTTVSVYARLPISRHEELEVVDNSTDNRQRENNVDNVKGVSRWQLEIGAGKAEQVQFDYQLSYPKAYLGIIE